MLSPTPLRDICLAAGFELKEMLRSRRAFLIIALYLSMAGFATYDFVQILTRTQNFTVPLPRYGRDAGPGYRPPNANGPGFTPTPAPPATTAPSQGAFFARGSPFRGILRNIVNEQPTMDYLLSKPLISLYFMFITLLAVPFIIMITASESIAQEHQSRGVRFVALRTGRVEFVVGKVLGQGLLMAAVILLSAGLCMAIAAWKLQDFSFAPTLSAMLVFWPRIVAFCVPFVGLAALCSMNTSSTLSARAFSLISLGGMFAIHQLTDYYSTTSFASFFTFLDFFEPYSHENDLWNYSYATVGSAMAILVGMGAVYVVAGLVFYRRRDL